ncbi:MAG: hypothetical protein Kapaf2KO_07240 [Candidatus Kapaibacteriales bacterium]
MTLVVGLAIPSFSANSPHEEGEYLEYEVTFLGMTLGTITTYTKSDEMVKGDKTHHVRSEIKTNPNIPYVDLNVVFDSWMDPSFAYSHKFTATGTQDGVKSYEEALFDYDNKKLVYNYTVGGKKEADETIELAKKVNDGCSLFFMARKYMDRNKTVKVPTFISNKDNLTIINFHDKYEDIEIEAIGYPVETKYLNGTAKWKGLYGLSGDFEGWFTNDEAAIPLKAKMNVYVGKVDITLVKWKRAGWKPKKAS